MPWPALAPLTLDDLNRLAVGHGALARRAAFAGGAGRARRRLLLRGRPECLLLSVLSSVLVGRGREASRALLEGAGLFEGRGFLTAALVGLRLEFGGSVAALLGRNFLVVGAALERTVLHLVLELTVLHGRLRC